ncbi:helix-turn-helix domain-containing protein [Natranaerobius thermophilus]|uniref:Transcriptional regulator n=1 Tax=Natranaerobius thermophilus (strain ATCC BAA-1301 / DSM 18059 / JW/NM-WN-LF) TaxID=457570 RepID=B2A3T6_NATTJ|nr:hypothetical protein [Natranaerobius thermophilus]ACB83712.1 conserved hypothetical protein [Natranaerobius thermophilus JW/NM-WN-LF]
MDIEYIRVGEKLININKIEDKVRKLLNLRAQGYSQKEVSNKLEIDRTFVSRVESMGEVRKGGGIAVIGFPIKNKDELLKICDNYGVEYCFLMTDQERWTWLKNKSGEMLINRIMELVYEVRVYDIVVVLGSNYRINLIKALLNKEVIGLKIGESPIEKDVYVSSEKFAKVLDDLV